MDALKEASETPQEFERLMAEVRPRLHAYLLSLTGSGSVADDLVQETSLVLWEKWTDYDPEGDFRAWAFRIGFLQAQNHRRKEGRRHVRELPGEDIFERIAEVSEECYGRDDQEEKRHEAMIHCLAKLRESHRELVLRRYRDERSLEDLSREAGTNRNAMAQRLFRLRRTLLRCIARKLGRPISTS